MRRGNVVWRPTAEAVGRSRLADYQRWLTDSSGLHFDGYDDLWRWSVAEPDAFWMSIWTYFDVLASKSPSCAVHDRAMPDTEWFPQAQLNYAENMLRGEDGQVVVVGISQTRDRVEFTRGELRDLVARAAAGLRRLGVRPGDRVVGYLPNIPEALVAMLACASVGAVWAACAPETGVRSVLDRFGQLEPKVLIAVDGYRYGEKSIDRREAVRQLVAGLPSLSATVSVGYLFGDRSMAPCESGGLPWPELISRQAAPQYTQLPFSAPLWILFSSGTTGLPKAIVHSHGGITVEQLKFAALHGDRGPADRDFVFCTTSWVMWNISVSSLLVGAGVVLMDGDPNYPGTSALWQVVEETGATSFGCGAAYLVACMREGQRPGERYDLSRLRTLLSTGSPLPAEGFGWVYEAVSCSLQLQSSSGGTDVCTAFVASTPWHPVRAGEIACRCLGVLAEAFDPQGRAVVGRTGELVISSPMPSMPLYFWNDPRGERMTAAYFQDIPGRWRHGDWVEFTQDGACVIHGRSDGTLNRGGVRLGTAEFYAVVEGLAEVADSLVVHIEDPGGGNGRLILFLVVSPGHHLDAHLRRRIATELRAALSPRHVPDEMHAVNEIPYNLTGKKLEVPVKRLLQGADVHGVISMDSMRNPDSIEPFRRLAAQGA